MTNKRQELVERMAEAIHDNCYADEYKDLHENSIERALAIQQANAVLDVVLAAIEDGEVVDAFHCEPFLRLKPDFQRGESKEV